MSGAGDRDLEELIDAYVEGLLDTAEILALERRMEEDASLRLRIALARMRSLSLRDSLGRLSSSGRRAFEKAEPLLRRVSESRARANRASAAMEPPLASSMGEPSVSYRRDLFAWASFERIWERVAKHEGLPFETAGGVRFTYVLKGDLLVLSDTPIRIRRKDLEVAFFHLRDAPRTRRARSGSSEPRRADYVESVLRDRRILGR